MNAVREIGVGVLGYDGVARAHLHALLSTAPNDLHAEPSIEAMRLGRHVLCEKPIGTRDSARRSCIP